MLAKPTDISSGGSFSWHPLILGTPEVNFNLIFVPVWMWSYLDLDCQESRGSGRRVVGWRRRRRLWRRRRRWRRLVDRPGGRRRWRRRSTVLGRRLMSHRSNLTGSSKTGAHLSDFIPLGRKVSWLVLLPKLANCSFTCATDHRYLEDRSGSSLLKAVLL